MPDKDVDEQFAAIMAHWHEDALGLDPYGDPDRESGREDREDRDGSDSRDVPHAKDGTAADPDAGPTAHLDALDALTSRDLDDLRDLDAPGTSSTSGASGATPVPPPVPTAPVAPPDEDAPPATGSTSTPRPGTAWRAHVPAEDPDEEHYVPPPPQPLPSSEDKHFWLMMLGLVGGPLLLLYLLLFDRDGNGWFMLGAIAMTVAGFVLLVLRQPFERDEDDDGVRL